MKFKTKILAFLLTFNMLALLGIENRPKMRRACLDRFDSTLDLLWFKPTDNCSSFTSFSLYGRDNALNSFQFLASYSSYSLNNISIKLKNNSIDWEFYIVYNKACNGIDSVYSDTISIDNTPPVDSQLDSVSVDFITQRTILGWSANPSPDIKGYFAYNVTGSGVNTVITSTTNTFYADNSSRDPATAPFRYRVAAFDSCNNTSLMSEIHTTIHLKSTYNQCQKTISLNWTPYGGWETTATPVKDYQIFLKVNSGSYQLIGTVVPAISPQFTYNFPAFGDTYCFYIRAIRTGATMSSSSNIVCVSTASVTPSKLSYIAKASVQNSQVELTLITQTGTSLQKINIYRAENSNSFSLWQSLNTTGGIIELKDNNVSVQIKYYQYYFTTEGPCNLIFDTSQTAKTILLNVVMISPGDQQLNWNLYNDFIKLTQNQELLLSDNDQFNKSSPWNILTSFDNTTKFANDNTLFAATQEKICYCIRAIENPATVTYNRQDTSYSNIQCVTADPIVFFPNAIQINGFNTIFYPKGVFIDYEKSSFNIYNRWGEIIFETNDIRKGWDGKENNEYVQSDVYVYRAIIVGINGKTLFFDGTITVLK